MWEDIRKEYENTDATLKELADLHGVKIGTIKSRKSREGWKRDAPKKVATKKKDATPKKKEVAPEKMLPKVSEDLTEKQRLFCVYYVKTFNATQSAINAGYGAAGAHVEGNRLLKNVKVSAEIKRLKEDMTSQVYVSAKDVLDKYIKIAFSDITDYLTFGRKEVERFNEETGEIETVEVNHVDFKNSDSIDGTIINEVKQGKDGVSIKLEDKMKALEKLDKYFDLFPDKFKRNIEAEKLKIAQFKILGNEDEEYEDDGFLEALDGKEVKWDEET